MITIKLSKELKNFLVNEQILERFLKNVTNIWDVDNGKQDEVIVTKFKGAFIWSSTNEGFQYWEKKNQKYMKWLKEKEKRSAKLN